MAPQEGEIPSMNEPVDAKQALYFEDLQQGDSWISGARTLTETDIVNFACHTGDFDPLHVDHHFAKETPFRQPIAHGLLGLAWVAGLGSHFPRIRTAAFIKISEWIFLKPMFVGDTVHVSNEVESLEISGRRRGRVVWRRRLINQDGAVVQEGLLETLVWRRV